MRLISLETLTGFMGIVLVGVDSRQSQFFWEAQPSPATERSMSSFFTSEGGPLHSTETTDSFPVTGVLPLIAIATYTLWWTGLAVMVEKSWVSAIPPVSHFSEMKEDGRR